jgi:hypothetical protein
LYFSEICGIIQVKHNGSRGGLLKKVRVKPAEQRDDILADWRTGEFTQTQLADKYGVAIGTINNYCKGVPHTNSVLLKKIVESKHDLAVLNEKERDSVMKIAEQKTSHLVYLSHQAVINVQEAMEAGCGTQADYFSRAGTILRAKEVIAGKAPETAIQVNNTINEKSTPEHIKELIEGK